MKVGLLEVCSKNHYVLLEAWIKVLHKLDIEAILYISEDVNELVDKKLKIQKIIKKKNMSIKNFLKKVNNENIDHLIITSLQSHMFDFYLYFNPKYTFSLTVHNAATWFEGNQLNSIKNIVKRIIRNKFLNKAQNYFVSSENMKEYVESLDKNFEKNIYNMPFMLFEPKNIGLRNTNRIKKIVYPGLISAARKKYETFFMLAKKYPDIEFVLLGAPSNNPKERSLEVIEKIKKLDYNNIKYFETYLSAEEYTKEFNNADFIFSELSIEFKKEDYREVYGMSKDTGISYLMIKNCIPLIVNSDFTNLKSLNSSTLYFNSLTELDSYIEVYNEDEKYNDLLYNTIQLSNLFTAETVANNLKEKGFLNEIK